MLNKLEAIINEKESNIVVLQYGLKEEQSLYLTNHDNMLATVTYNQEEQVYEIDIEEYDAYNEEYYLIECKYYKTAGRAFNYLKKMLP
jgi:hypothetical protein